MHATREVVMRLSRYKNVLQRLKTMGFVKVFSDNLADALNVSPSLVRKDFALFGLTGKKRGGYRVDELIEQLNRILGKGAEQNIVIVGCGKIGTALMNYSGFLREGIQVAAGFDADLSKINPSAPIPVYDVKDLPAFLDRRPLDVAVLALPETAAPQAADLLMAHGVKGILNFAPVNLKSTDHCAIQNINLAVELENLFYFIRFKERAGKFIPKTSRDTRKG